MQRRRWWLWGAVWWMGACLPAAAAEFRLAGGVWDYEVTGYQDDHGTITDFQTFAPGRQRDGFLQLEYEHRPSWLPDLAAAYAQVSGEGSQTTSSSPLPPLPLPLPLPDPTTTTTTASGDFRALDFTARYALSLGPLKISPGLTLSWLKGEIETSDSGSGQSNRNAYSQVFPMLHAQIAWPATSWLRLVAQGDWISANHNQAYQYGAAVEVKVLGPLGLYGGWHGRRYKLSSGDSFIDASLRGWRYGLSIAF